MISDGDGEGMCYFVFSLTADKNEELKKKVKFLNDQMLALTLLILSLMYCCTYYSPFLNDKLVLETEEIERIKEEQIQVKPHQSYLYLYPSLCHRSTVN